MRQEEQQMDMKRVQFNDNFNVRFPVEHIRREIRCTNQVQLRGSISEKNGDYIFYVHSVPEEVEPGKFRYPLRGKRITVARLEKAANTALERSGFKERVKLVAEEIRMSFDDDELVKVLVAHKIKA